MVKWFCITLIRADHPCQGQQKLAYQVAAPKRESVKRFSEAMASILARQLVSGELGFQAVDPCLEYKYGVHWTHDFHGEASRLNRFEEPG